jgi:hypothetical protein
VPPFQGWALFASHPRALPWAGLFAHLWCSRRSPGKAHDKALEKHAREVGAASSSGIELPRLFF